MSTSSGRDGRSAGGLARLLCLLWLAGVAMRMTLLVTPPVIPQLHDELHMSETQVGLLIGLPLAMLAVAAIPGSLLIARVGATLAVTLGMAIAAIGGAARAAAIDVWTLYAAAIVSQFGIAIIQPGMPTLVREWLLEPPCTRNHWLFQRHAHGRDVPRDLHHRLYPTRGRQELAAGRGAVGNSGAVDRPGLFVGQPKDP